jgi:RecA-family ATPase
MSLTLADAALEYAERGWLVMPLHTPTASGCSCGRRDCGSQGKHPRTAHGLKDASCDPATIREWWNRWPDANIGIVTGTESGILVLDVDGNLGDQSLTDLTQRGAHLPETYTIQTGKGQHIYFLWPEGADVRNSQSRIAPGLDIRGMGGYVVAPPSLHASGAQYEVKASAIPPVSCPEWLLSIIHCPENRQEACSASASEPIMSGSFGRGHRTTRLVSLAGSMQKRGMNPRAIEAALLVENETFSPPLVDAKVRAIADDISARYPNSSGKLIAQAGTMNSYALVPLGELMAQPDAPVDYLLENRLVIGTVSTIVAKPKVGKSTFARNLALAVSTGRPFLGSLTRQGEVIYLALEERAEEIKADFKAMGATGNEPIHIYAANAPEDAMAELIGLVRDRKPRLLVIDPLFRFARIRDEKAYAETYQALGPLIDVARETDTHILLTHHAGKGLKADAIDAPLGSTALGGIVSTLLVLKRTEIYRALQTVQRIGDDLPETVLSFDPLTRTLMLGPSKAELERSEAEKRILEYLEGIPEPQTQEQIRDGVEGQTKTIRAALTALTQSEKVQRSGEGRRGNPYLYEKWFSGSHHKAGTREPEIEEMATMLVKPEEKVVLDNRQGAIPFSCPVEGDCGGLLQ